MNKRAFPYLIVLMALPLAVGLACGSSTPAAGPTQAPAATEAPASSSTSSSEQVTFTDQNKYLEFDLPGDWTYSQDKDTTNDYWYWDAFKSPDKHAGVESVVFDDGTAWTGGQSGKQALYMLHQFYSFTGKEGDIRISDDSMQKDGSERLTWESKGGKSKGISFFEVRKRTAFLMFTVWWDNDFESQYSDRLNAVIDSYRVP